jgi:hypothetical protein
VTERRKSPGGTIDSVPLSSSSSRWRPCISSCWVSGFVLANPDIEILLCRDARGTQRGTSLLPLIPNNACLPAILLGGSSRLSKFQAPQGLPAVAGATHAPHVFPKRNSRCVQHQRPSHYGRRETRRDQNPMRAPLQMRKGCGTLKFRGRKSKLPQPVSYTSLDVDRERTLSWNLQRGVRNQSALL